MLSPTAKMGSYVRGTSLLLLSFLMYPLLAFSELPPDQKSAMITLSQRLNITHSPWSGSDPCSWKGVTCSSNSVISLSLSGFGLSNPDFLPVLCQLDSLRSLNLSNNFLSSIDGLFSTGCGRMDGLKVLDLSKNRLDHSLPSFKNFVGLEVLDLSWNFLNGRIDSQLVELTALKLLNLSFNKFDGPVPTLLGKSMVLEKLQLSMNRFQGAIPVQILQYQKLTLVDLSSNNLTGSIPEAIGNLSNLQLLILSNNHLSGEIPKSLSNIPSLERFAANQNSFTGTIPTGITSSVKSLDLSYNKLTGLIPSDLLFHPNLQTVDLSYNLLKGSIPQNMSNSLVRLRLGSNSLSGVIPTSFATLENFKYLELDNNSLTGLIPQQLGSCQNLLLLNLAQNNLTGELPVQLGDLRNLEVLELQMNNLDGGIPNEFAQLSNLSVLNIGWNLLSGTIPTSISKLSTLTHINLQSNNLNGSIPDAIIHINHLLELQLGGNSLSGVIPTMPPSLQIALNLSSNMFEGLIPRTFSQLTSLEVLDLSNNSFSGEVPDFLKDMSSLTQLILSNNKLSGILPSFDKRVSVNVSGNQVVLNDTPPNKYPASTKKGKSIVVAISVALAAAALAVSIGIIIAISISRRCYKVNDNRLQSSEDLPLPQVIRCNLLTANGIHRSNIDFAKAIEEVANPANIVLKTRFSTYYKAIMPSGTSYFVKKLNWADKIFQLGSHDKFGEELEALGKLSNSNVMIPLAYVLTLDSAYLFYEFAPKGTLFDVLHGNMKSSLDWASRYSIAVGVAQGLAFLHGCTSGPILLLDLSSRNVTLKSLKEPQIGDIELCKVIDPSKSTGSISAVAGSVGYIPPEYAYTMRVTMAGNVYSFGVLLLELLTGKPAVSKGTELAKWVTSNSVQQDKLDRLLDFNVIRTSLAVRSQMLAVLKVALACVSVSPEARPKIKSVLRMLLNAR